MNDELLPLPGYLRTKTGADVQEMIKDYAAACAQAARAPLLAQEPVAWAVYWKDGQGLVSNGLSYVTHLEPSVLHLDQIKVPLYTAPVPAIDVDEAMRLADRYAKQNWLEDGAGVKSMKARAALAAHLDKLGGK
jgi:hypothetical protein